MKRRALFGMLCVLGVLTALLLVSPGISGEHPWDADGLNDSLLIAKDVSTMLPTDTTGQESGEGDDGDSDSGGKAGAYITDSLSDLATVVWKLYITTTILY